MRHSEFRGLVEDEFGATYAATLLRDHVLGALGNRTADEALGAGEDPRRVWRALCEDLDVPVDRRLGRQRPALPPNDPGPAQ